MTLGIVGLSLVLVTGYSGQISLCQFSFMGIGAFVMGKIAGGGSLLGLLAATIVCAGGRGAGCPAHHPAPGSLSGAGHLRVRRRGGQRVLFWTPISTARAG